MYGQLSTEEKIIKVKIRLQESHPFWAYLILRMDIQPDKQNVLPDYAGMGVNVHGRMIYKSEFVNSLDEHQLEFCLAHEVSHLVYEHLLRLDTRVPLQWNVATDIVINHVLVCNRFSAPKCGLIPDYNHSIKSHGLNIVDLHKKSSEQVYSEVGENEDFMKKISELAGTPELSFDEHQYGGGLTKSEKEELSDKWKDNLIEAATYAKTRGKLPSDIGKLIGDLLEPKINWKQMIKRFIVSYLPYDYSFSRPNKKFHHVILPGVVKDAVEVVVALDTSGSISPKELGQFLGECMSLARSHNNLKMTLIECDARIRRVLEFTTNNATKISNIKPQGGGGTSHQPVVDYILDKLPNTKLLITLTDGYSDIESCFNKLKCAKIIVLNSDYEGLEKYGKVIHNG